MAAYTVILGRWMSEVHNVEADDLKTAVAVAHDQANLTPSQGASYDAAGDVEVTCVELDGAEVWHDGDDENDLY